MDTIATESLLLRPLTMQDAYLIEKYASDYDVAKTTQNIPHPYPKGSGKDFVKAMVQAQEECKVVIFAIEEKASSQLIGLININITMANNHGELGYWVGKPFWGKGYGTEASEKMIAYGFEELNLHKIFARAFAHNPGSWRIMEKIGMTCEGTLKEHLKRSGEYYDLVFYGMLKREYNLIRSSNI